MIRLSRIRTLEEGAALGPAGLTRGIFEHEKLMERRLA